MQLVQVPARVLGFVTTTLYVPAALAGAVAVSSVPLTKVTLVADVPPIVIVGVKTKFVPLIVMDNPPAVVCGFWPVTEVTMGARTQVTVPPLSLSYASPTKSQVTVVKVIVPDVLARTLISRAAFTIGKVKPSTIFVLPVISTMTSSVPTVVWKVSERVSLSSAVMVTGESITRPVFATE